MFPFDITEQDLQSVTTEQELEPSDYEIDFRTGKLTGKIITRLDAIVQWVRLVLSTDRYYFIQYPWIHGSELASLIGRGFTQEYVKNEANRMVVDAMKENPFIDAVKDFTASVEGDHLTCNFTLETVYGNREVQFDV